MVEPRDLSLHEAGRRLRAGSLTARQLLEACFERRRLGAYCHVDEELSRRQAHGADEAFSAGRDLGPLQGIPVSIKDLYGVAGMPTFGGTSRRLPPRYEETGPVVGRLLEQRGVVTGKTHTVELAFGGIGTNPHYPTPVNPWDSSAHRVPGGSSAGAGVSLCEGSALLALGTDTAGSVRIPAAWTGNVALKTTAGRWSTDGIVPLSTTLDTTGVLARTVTDLAAAFAALDPAPGEVAAVEVADLSLARCETLAWQGCSPGVAEAVEEALSELEGAGARLSGMALPEARRAWALFKRGGPVAVELHRTLTNDLDGWLERIDPNVAARVAGASELTEEEYQERLALLDRLAASARERLAGVDALVMPTVANTPPLLDDVANAETYAQQNVLCLRNTSLASYLGLSAITLPAGLDACGMPVGLHLVGRGGQEERLLAVALACEGVLGTGAERLGQPPRLA